MNPLDDFGRRSARLVLDSLAAVPAGQRDQALRMLFDTLDPKLSGRVEKRTAELVAEGVPEPRALELAMSASMTQGLVEQFVRASQGGSGKPRSTSGAEALGFCGPICLAKKAGGAVQDAGSKVVDWGSAAANAIGKLGCKVASNPAGQIAAAGGSAALGVPPQAGLMGAQVVAQVCAKPAPSPLPGVLPPGTPEWVVPAAIGGGALVLFLLLR